LRFAKCLECGNLVLSSYLEKHSKFCSKSVEKVYIFELDEQAKVIEEVDYALDVGREWGCYLKLIYGRLRKHKPRLGARYAIAFEFPPDFDVVGRLHSHPLFVSFSILDTVNAVRCALWKGLGEKRWLEILVFPDYSFHAWLFPTVSEVASTFDYTRMITPYDKVREVMLRTGLVSETDALLALTWIKIEPELWKMKGKLGDVRYVFKIA